MEERGKPPTNVVLLLVLPSGLLLGRVVVVVVVVEKCEREAECAGTARKDRPFGVPSRCERRRSQPWLQLLADSCCKLARLARSERGFRTDTFSRSHVGGCIAYFNILSLSWIVEKVCRFVCFFLDLWMLLLLRRQRICSFSSL